MAEHREMDVGRSPRIVMVAPGIGARLDGDEPVIAFAVGLCASGAGEVRIERRRMLVANMDIASAGIGLPEFDQCVGHAASVFIQHMAMHDDALSDRFALVLGGEIGIARAYGLVAVHRAGQFRQRVAHDDQRLGRRTLHRALVVRRQPRRMGFVAFGRIGECHGELSPSLRANGSRECAPDDKLHEAIRSQKKEWIAASLRSSQ